MRAAGLSRLDRVRPIALLEQPDVIDDHLRLRHARIEKPRQHMPRIGKTVDIVGLRLEGAETRIMLLMHSTNTLRLALAIRTGLKTLIIRVDMLSL